MLGWDLYVQSMDSGTPSTFPGTGTLEDQRPETTTPPCLCCARQVSGHEGSHSYSPQASLSGLVRCGASGVGSSPRPAPCAEASTAGRGPVHSFWVSTSTWTPERPSAKAKT